MNECIQEREFNLLIEDALSEQDIARLESHARECPACRAGLDGWKELKNALRAAAEVEVPSTLKARVMHGVKQQKMLPAVQPLGFKRILAASVLVLLLAGYYLMPAMGLSLEAILKEAFLSAMTVLYSLLSLIGLDVKTVLAVFKSLVEILIRYFWFFAASTLVLIMGFFSVVFFAKPKLKAN